MELIKEGETMLLSAEAWNAVIITLNALYEGRFQHKPLSDPDNRRNLANFLHPNLHHGSVLYDETEE